MVKVYVGAHSGQGNPHIFDVVTEDYTRVRINGEQWNAMRKESSAYVFVDSAEGEKELVFSPAGLDPSAKQILQGFINNVGYFYVATLEKVLGRAAR